LIALAACDRAAEHSAVSLRIDGRSNANPSIAARGDVVVVAWSASTKDTTDVYAAISQDAGRTFGRPIRVNFIAGDARVNSEFPPRVAIAGGAPGHPDITVVWTTRRDADTRILSAKISWGPTRSGEPFFLDRKLVPGSEGRGARGWQSVAVDSSGRILVAWLDHRDVPPMAAEHHHGSGAATGSKGADDATARAAPSKLLFASLSDSSAITITGSVCYCCKTALAARGENVYAAWRHVYPGSARNIAFAMSKDGGRTFSAPVPVSDDHWQIDGCPENGPAIAVDQQGRAHVVWVTPPDGKSETPLGLFYASTDNGSSFHPRVAIPTHGPAAHAQIVEQGGSLIAAWDEIAGSSRRVGFAALTPKADGTIDIEPLAFRGEGETGWPVLAATSRGVLGGWVSRTGTKSEIVVTTLR
jgi:hypothetical protein